MAKPLVELRSVVDEHEVVRHPFLQDFSKGQLTKDQVVKWFEQQFHFSTSLPKCFAALYARIEGSQWKTTGKLADLIQTEAWGSSAHDAHSIYFKEVAKYLGIDLETLSSEAPREFSSTYIRKRLAVCLDSRFDVTTGLAAIALGNEYLNLHIFRAYREGIHKIVGLEDCPTGYFDAHLRDEEDDFSIFQDLYEANSSHENRSQAKEKLIELLDSRVSFFDDLLAYLNIDNTNTKN